LSLVDAALAADDRRRSSLAQFESLRAEQKSMGKQVAQATGEEKAALIGRSKELAGQVKEHQGAANAAEAELDELLYRIPNLVDGAPAGGEENFVTLKTVGTPRDFAAEGFTPRDHLDLGESLGAIDT